MRNVWEIVLLRGTALVSTGLAGYGVNENHVNSAVVVALAVIAAGTDAYRTFRARRAK